MTRNEPVTAVILNWKDEKNTLACVEHLANSGDLKAIYIVNNEAAHPIQISQSQKQTIATIHQISLPENRGFSAGINVGTRAALEAGATSILYINNDARIDAENLALLCRELQQKHADVVAPVILNPDGTVQASGARISKFSLAVEEQISYDDADFLTFACVLITAETFRRVGLLDEAFFMYWEDVDFGLRVKAAGLSQRVVRDAVATHEVSSSRKIAGSRIDLYSAFGLGVFGAKHRTFHLAARRRMVLRVAKQIAMLNFSFAFKLLRAFKAGGKLTRPCYPDVAKVDWPKNA